MDIAAKIEKYLQLGVWNPDKFQMLPCTIYFHGCGYSDEKRLLDFGAVLHIKALRPCQVTTLQNACC
jgi:hypothetical protein